MNAGALRERVTVTKRSETTDTQGGRAVTWVDLVTSSATDLTKLWAAVVPVSAAEQLEGAAVGSVGRYQVTLRYRTDVLPTMRVSWTPYLATTAKTLEIHGVQPVGTDRAFVVLDCAERA